MTAIVGSGRNVRPLRILVAEDDASMRSWLADVLRRDGHEVIEARNGAELLLRIREADRVDVVVTDVRMPAMSGLDAIACLNEAAVGVPVVVVTAFGDDETHRTAERFGAIVVLDKPFGAPALRAALARAISGDAKADEM